MKPFHFTKPYRCYALMPDRTLVPHDIAVTGLNYADGRAAITGYAKIVLEDREIVKFLAPYNEWEGYVTAVRDDGYVEINLVDITAQSDEVDSMATIPIELFEPDQRGLLADGVLFRMFCGYTMVAGAEPSPMEMTLVLFPALTEADIEAMKLRIAEALKMVIPVDRGPL